MSDVVLILKCMADENFDALLTLLVLIYLSWMIKLQEERIFTFLALVHSSFVQLYITKCSLRAICTLPIGPSAHTCSTVDHRHEEAHASYVLFRSQAGLSLFLFCHAAWDESTTINQTLACCSTSYMSAAHPTHSKYF